MKAPVIAMMLSLALSTPALAATFVYVSNADDGDIGIYTLQPDGSLQAGPRVAAAKVVMPMAVSPDKRFLIAAVRSKPYEAYTYAIDKKTGALNPVGKGPLAESYPYISIDATGRYLFGRRMGPTRSASIRSARTGRSASRSRSSRPRAMPTPSASTTRTVTCSCRTSARIKSSSSCSTRRPASLRRTHRPSCR